MTESPRKSHLVLPDGRQLAWSEWGPEHGAPVLFCTGAGMSGSLGFGVEHLDSLGVRLIAIDRPGLGRSSHDPEKSLSSWASDVETLIAKLGLADPGAVGFSQGGPFALALAARGLVKAVALVSAQDDLGHPAIRSLLPEQVAGMVDAARTDPGGFEAHMARMVTDEFLWTLIRDMSAPCDREIYESPDFAPQYRTSLQEGFAQGAAGYARDLVIALNEWPFALEEIATPVDLWYGALDTSPVHSPDFGRTLASRLPAASLTVDPDRGSSLLWTRSRKSWRNSWRTDRGLKRGKLSVLNPDSNKAGCSCPAL